MNPEKVGNFIKELRKKNNLTQNDLAQKYGVTYQAVSKWERGTNLPDISLLREMSKDFDISLEDFLDGEIKNNIKRPKYNIIIPIIIGILIIIIIALILNKNNSFQFKTLSTSCSAFKLSGSIAYNSSKSSIYISNIDYCGGDDNTIYEKIECNLYEVNDNVSSFISSCKKIGYKEKLEDYLKELELNIDNYPQKCKTYNDTSLYLEIKAVDSSEKTITYKLPLKLNNNCPR